MTENSKYQNLAKETLMENRNKSNAFKALVAEEIGKTTYEMNVNSHVDETEDEEKVTAEDFDTEFDKAMYMMQCYPCLRYNLASYLPIMKRKVIGQDKVLEKLIFVAYYNQYVNFLEEYTQNDNYKYKSMFLIAPTGCGKSTMLRALEKAFGVPVYRANVTAMTSAGYVGDKIESMLLGLIDRAKGDVASAERGILLIDEIDKKITSTTNDRDVAGKSVQQELLKLFERGVINLPANKKNPEQPTEFNTGNLTIILAGACVGLDEIRKKRLSKKKIIGFNSAVQDEENTNAEYTTEDLVEYGFIPELVGRIDIVEEFEPYTQSKLVDIIYFSEESSMQEHVRVLSSLGVDKIMIDGILWEKIAEEILDNKLGVRELNRKMTKLFYPILFEAFQHTGSGTCVIDEDGKFTLEYVSTDEIYTGKGIELKEFNEALLEN